MVPGRKTKTLASSSPELLTLRILREPRRASRGGLAQHRELFYRPQIIAETTGSVPAERQPETQSQKCLGPDVGWGVFFWCDVGFLCSASQVTASNTEFNLSVLKCHMRFVCSRWIRTAQDAIGSFETSPGCPFRAGTFPREAHTLDPSLPASLLVWPSVSISCLQECKHNMLQASEQLQQHEILQTDRHPRRVVVAFVL